MDDFTNCENNVQLNGKVAIVTGATSGTGLEVAKIFAKRGAKVIIASRNPAKLIHAKNQIEQYSVHDSIVARQLDFESLKSIRSFAFETIRSEPKVDILINNIGSVGLPDRLTEDGLQTMMQVNYFGTFLLTYLLFPLLRRSAPSRIVNISSLALLIGDINFDKWNKVGAYSNFGFYSNAKLAEIIFTVEMNRRIRGSGVKIYSMDPGLGKSELFRNVDNEGLRKILNTGLLIFGRPLHRVATMPVFLAVDPRVEDKSGQHFRDCMVFYSSWEANNTILGRKLWEETKKLVKISPEEDWDDN